MEGSLVGALQHGPERLDPVGMCHALTYSKTLCLTVSGGFGIPDRRSVVGVDHGVRVRHFVHEALQRGLVSAGHDLGADLSLLSRHLAPTTAVMSTGPRPSSCLRPAFDLFLRFPPM